MFSLFVNEEKVYGRCLVVCLNTKTSYKTGYPILVLFIFFRSVN